MCRQSFHIADAQSMCVQYGDGRVEGEVGEVLVIYGIELPVTDQFHKMRELDRNHAIFG